MKIVDIIIKKRKGEKLSKEEIEFAVNGFTKGSIHDYQFSALLMAICFNGLDGEETIHLTEAMIASGNVLDLSPIPGIKVDKHSTGGVGDKTSLIVGPLVAAAGVKVAKLSGRGLGHTGGTTDKLESISGFSTQISMEHFFENVSKIGMCIGGQTGNLVPADKKIYALRDVTGTVDNLSLIASSVMSKKIASGADKIVLDVKVGDGAFMTSIDEATELAQLMVDIGAGMGRGTVALITDMDQPLGNAVGNAIEIKESIDTLRGKGPKDLHDICLELAAHMLLVAGIYTNKEKAFKALEELISSGKAFDKFKEFIQAQGGDISQIDNPDKLPQAAHKMQVLAPQDGFITHIAARGVGLVAVHLGAGREHKESEISYGAYVYLNKKVGDKVKKGEALAEIGADKVELFERAKKELLAAYTFGDTAPQPRPLVHRVVFSRGIEWE